jgi:predicted RNA binding protein YcfA (HicA-like mRNA interferase family)
MVKEFRDAGWVALRTDGSHTMYGCQTGIHGFALPDGHRSISAGVVRNARKAIAGCDCPTKTKTEEEE